MCIMSEEAYFVKAPTEEFLDKCTKEQLLKIAEDYEIEVSDQCLKDIKEYFKSKVE